MQFAWRVTTRCYCICNCWRDHRNNSCSMYSLLYKYTYHTADRHTGSRRSRMSAHDKRNTVHRVCMEEFLFCNSLSSSSSSSVSLLSFFCLSSLRILFVKLLQELQSFDVHQCRNFNLCPLRKSIFEGSLPYLEPATPSIHLSLTRSGNK